MDEKELKQLLIEEDKELQFTENDRQKVFQRIKNKDKNTTGFVNKKRIWPVFATCLALFIFGGLVLSSFLSQKESLPIASHEETKKNDAFSVLLLGQDSQSHRTEVHLFLTYHADKNTVKMITIPRDTYIMHQHSGKESAEKLGNVSAFNENIQRTKDQIEELIQVPIDYYVLFDINQLPKMLDNLGGFTIAFEESVTINGASGSIEVKEGENYFTGEELIRLFFELRKHPEISFELEEFISQYLKNNAENMSEIDLTEIIIETNVTSFQSVEADSIRHVEDLNISEDGTVEIVDGIYYYKLDENKIKEISEKFIKHLNE
ncbi:LCP family protein [Evansella cellulosilytica]|uniref:Cell envelope-related transcriptional attenuator n=1 Tax=Evansella cellulosilytica (strain ATCC 21833 / DSM 2522 / FERM P-1141 / JCM 9156 / N-4) TaxID=649639 RepID=E6U0S5_EVAC2|nr:LCP family protein [Evansella cellulosilytica]ADU29123.1 cell envelope-related transcriptional attenuator [Evansella cellulosilytica DSM 2522]